MKRSGQDSLTSWVIAGACCVINMMMFGMSRLSGVLFVATVQAFNISREKASFPYTLSNVIRNLIAPLVGFLGHRFGVRTVTTVGCIIAVAGVGTCYLATNINTLTILWGGVFGIGYGLGNLLLPVSTIQHFDKHRATASGISFSGACLGSFFLPPLVEILLNTYGLPGTFLVLSGFLLNCVPAAILLIKPRSEVKLTKKSRTSKENEKQSIMSHMNVKMYTIEDNYKQSIAVVDTKQTFPLKIDSPTQSTLTYEERITRLSTQTLLSDYSIRMSTSEPFDDKKIIENSKGRRKVDPDVLETDAFSVSSQNTDTDFSPERDDVFVADDFRSSSVQYDKPLNSKSLKNNRNLSCESIATNKKNFFISNSKSDHQNYGYQDDTDFIQTKCELVPQTIPQNDILKRTYSECGGDKSIYFNSYKRNSNAFTELYGKYKCSNAPSITNSIEHLSIDNFKVKNGKLDSYPDKALVKLEELSLMGAFSVLVDPIFLLTAVTNAIYSFTFICFFTIIVDFARDLHIGILNEKYVLMTLSIGDFIGRLFLGWITDGGYMSSTGFIALLFAFQGIFIAALPWSNSFITLMILVTLYGLSEAGIIVILPVIIAQYIDHDKRTVAVSSSHFFSGPICLAIAPMIGFFRDHLGSYDFIFYIMAILSFSCCFSWMLAPCIARCQRQQMNSFNSNVQDT